MTDPDTPEPERTPEPDEEPSEPWAEGERPEDDDRGGL